MGIGNAIIGALRVNLGLDSAAFTTGLKVAQGDISAFGRVAKLSLVGLTTAAVGVGAALVVASRNAIDHADALSKMAQKAGVSTESLSRLAYAAQFSDVSAEELTGSLGKLSKSMADATQNTKGQTASAFAALGISITDASGQMRSADAVFTDLADRFAQIPDGATKTAISMTLLGKSGANLIPLLNGGATELKRFADESDRFGKTISTKAGKAAEEFNDTMGKVGTAVQGVVTQFALSLLPDLQKFANALVTVNPEVLKWGGYLSGALLALGPVTAGIGVATPAIKLMTTAVVGLNTALLTLTGTLGAPALVAGLAFFASTTPAGAGEDALVRKLGLTKLPKNTSGSPDDRDKSGGVPITVRGGIGADQSDGINLDIFNKGLGDIGKGADTLKDKIDKLKGGLSAIGPVTGIVAQNFQDMVANSTGALGNLSGALSKAFKDNKAFAVSTAILNGLSAVSYALAGPFPWNLINAAAVGIETAANVADILSTNESSTSMPSGGSGGAASTSAAAAAPAAPSTTVYLQGSVFSGEAVADLLTNLIKDNGGQNFINVVRSPN